MENEIILELKDVLREIYLKGFEIQDLLKEKYSRPLPPESVSLSRRKIEAEIMVKPELFHFSLFDSFWKMFKSVSDCIENPLIQPWLRVIIEQTSDIFCYYEFKEGKKKEIACKHWLCVLGILGGKNGNLDYEEILKLLDSPSEKSKFSNLKLQGYPIKEFHKQQHFLFPSVNEENLPSSVYNRFKNIQGNPVAISKIEQFCRDMSLYHHPTIIIPGQIEVETKDKSHLFRSFALIQMCGLSLIEFLISEILEDLSKKLDENFFKKLRGTFEKIGKLRGVKK